MNNTQPILLPNGVVINDVPVGTTKQQVMERAIAAGFATKEDFADPEIPSTEAIRAENASRQPKTTMEKAAPYIDAGLEGAMAVPVMAGAARGVSSLFQGSKAAPYLKEFASAVMPKSGLGLLGEGALGFLSGAASKAVGDQFPEGTQRNIASTVTGAAVAAPFSLGKNAFELALSKGLGKEAAQGVGSAADTLGQIKGGIQAQTALRANPDLAPSILRASEIEQLTGVSLPILAASNGDTTISGYLQTQIAKSDNSAFTAQVKQQYKKAEEQLKAFRNGVAPSMKEVDDFVKQRASQVKTYNDNVLQGYQKRLQDRQKGINTLDDSITKTADALYSGEGKASLGDRLSNLISAKEQTIKKVLSPQYNDLLENSAKAGIKLPAENARELYSFAKSEINKDVFAKFPQLYSQINKTFKPASVVSKKVAEKYKFAKDNTTLIKDVELEDIDSLKRAVNKAISDTSDKDQLRKLYLLKKEVSKAVDAIDPVFSKPYKQLDAEYAKQLGLPFSEQGVLQITRAKFVENTVPVLTTKASSLKQTLGVIGDDPKGLKLVEDAFFADIANNASIIDVNTGQIKPAQLQRYLKMKKEQFDLIPDVRKKLEDVLQTTQGLITSKSNLEALNKQDKANYLQDVLQESFATSGGLQGYIRTALNNPQKMSDMLERVGKDPVALKAVKGAFLDDLLTQQGNKLEFFDSQIPNVAKVFGGDQVPPLRALIEAAQRLQQNPAAYRINVNTGGKTNYESVTGTRIDTSLGEVRNQVMSKHRVLLNHISRYFQGRSTQAEAAAIQEFLLNKEAMTTAAQMSASFQDKGVTEKFVNLGKKLFKNASTVYLQGALVGLMTGELNDEPYVPYKPTDESLLEGFGQ